MCSEPCLKHLRHGAMQPHVGISAARGRLACVPGSAGIRRVTRPIEEPLRPSVRLEYTKSQQVETIRRSRAAQLTSAAMPE